MWAHTSHLLAAIESFSMGARKPVTANERNPYGIRNIPVPEVLKVTDLKGLFRQKPKKKRKAKNGKK